MKNQHADVNQYIGERIKHYRERKGVPIQQLAESLEMDVDMLNMVEKGKEEITLEQLVTIANSLDISADCLMADLLEYGNTSNHSDAVFNYEEYQDFWSRIPEKKRTNFLVLLDSMINLLASDKRDPDQK